MSYSTPSHDSEAAWTTLGTRMRRNRIRLFAALAALGLYVGFQAVSQLSRQHDNSLEAAVATTLASDGTTAETSPETKTGQPEPAVAATRAAQKSKLSENQSNKSRKNPRRSTSTSARRTTKVANLVEQVASQSDKNRAKRTNPTTDELQAAEALGVQIGNRLTQSSSAATHWVASRVARAAVDFVRSAKPSNAHQSPTSIAALPSVAIPRSTAIIPATVMLVNPAHTGGVVHFLLNGQERTLQPGESQQFPSGKWRIDFDRGREFGETSYALRDGRYRFEVTATGWELRRSRE